MVCLCLTQLTSKLAFPELSGIFKYKVSSVSLIAIFFNLICSVLKGISFIVCSTHLNTSVLGSNANISYFDEAIVIKNSP